MPFDDGEIIFAFRLMLTRSETRSKFQRGDDLVGLVENEEGGEIGNHLRCYDYYEPTDENSSFC